jgi:hypothetical protein
MRRFIEEADRTQLTLLPESLDDYIGESNPVRAIEAFVAHLDLADLGFEVVPEVTGRPGYHPSVLLRLYIYGYLNRISSSRCLEREAGRNGLVVHASSELSRDTGNGAYAFWGSTREAFPVVTRNYLQAYFHYINTDSTSEKL